MTFKYLRVIFLPRDFIFFILQKTVRKFGNKEIYLLTLEFNLIWYKENSKLQCKKNENDINVNN